MRYVLLLLLPLVLLITLHRTQAIAVGCRTGRGMYQLADDHYSTSYEVYVSWERVARRALGPKGAPSYEEMAL
jgi:hypothetical protein